MQGHDIAITGGSSGIGKATAIELDRLGAHTHLIARNRRRLDETAGQLPNTAGVHACDINDHVGLADCFEAIGAKTAGTLDGLVVNAARYGLDRVRDTSIDRLRDFMETNVVSTLALVKLALPLLERGAGKSIVIVSSTLSLKPVPATSAYAASKAATNSLVKSFALELADVGIRVNAVLPGVIDTPIHDPQTESDPARATKMAQLGPIHPLGRVGSAAEVAHMIRFLLSADADWVTGSLFTIDGGISVA